METPRIADAARGLRHVFLRDTDLVHLPKLAHTMQRLCKNINVDIHVAVTAA